MYYLAPVGLIGIDKKERCVTIFCEAWSIRSSRVSADTRRPGELAQKDGSI